jgi:hypothetical protein
LPTQNFLASIFEAQYGRKMVLQDGSTTQLGEMMDQMNLFFTAYFTIELFVNAFANWMEKFIYNGWNHLDVFIVIMSLVVLGPLEIPSWLVQLMRAFRVIRLFGRITQLKKMTAAVTASLFPMMNAFIILMIVLSICASYSFLLRTARPSYHHPCPTHQGDARPPVQHPFIKQDPAGHRMLTSSRHPLSAAKDHMPSSA